MSKITVKPSYYLTIDLVSMVSLWEMQQWEGSSSYMAPRYTELCFQGPLRPLFRNSENWFSIQPFTTATDTVRPLTPSLFGPSRATSPHGIINQLEARRLDWPPRPLALREFPQPYVCGSPCPTPPWDQRKALQPRTTAQTGTVQLRRSIWAAQFHILGPASHRNPSQRWLC